MSLKIDVIRLPETVLQDLRYGIRMLTRDAGFTCVAVLALALGIGVNTAVFTAYKAMIARPLDARDPGHMVNLALLRDSGAAEFTFSYPDYQAYRDSAHSLSALIAFSPEHLRLSDAGGIVNPRESATGSILGRLGLLPPTASHAEFAATFAVSENYFQVLGVAAVRGRTFDSIGIPELLAAPAVLISENYWQRRFAGDPAILGKTIHLNGAALTIVGITPHDFVGTSVGAPDFWLPLCLEPLVHSDGDYLHEREEPALSPVRPSCSRRHHRAGSGGNEPLEDRVRRLHDPRSNLAKPATMLVWPGSPFPLPMTRYPGLRLAVVLIMAAAVMVLAVACANVAGLQMARARSRQSELETRLSLGAGRLRIIRQLLTESALLGLLAGGLALLFTWALLKAFVILTAQAFPADQGTLIFVVTPDLAIFAYVFAISLVAGILFGLAPALESSRSALSSTVRCSASSVRSRRLQDFLIAVQVALSLVLMIAGSLLIRSAINSVKMETGYDTKPVVDLDLQFPEGSKYTARSSWLWSASFALAWLLCPEWLRSRRPGRPAAAAVQKPLSRSTDKSRRRTTSRPTSTTPSFRSTISRSSAFP